MSKFVRFFIVDPEYLRAHPNEILVCDGNFSDKFTRPLTREVVNQIHPFITHILPRTGRNNTGQFFTPEAYVKIIYPIEEALLLKAIKENPDKTFLIDPLGYFTTAKPWDMFSTFISVRLRKKLRKFNNVVLLWRYLPNRYNFDKESKKEKQEDSKTGDKQCQENKSLVTTQD